MKLDEYINFLGFKNNPFEHSNADKEVEYLSDYFISPSYFEDVWGNPYNPVSNIIYAPRGGGKTAQRIMIEKRAKESEDILTIIYTNHDLSSFNNISEITISYHLTYFNRLLLIAFFSKIENDEFRFSFIFSYAERQYIYSLTRIYLYETPASFPNQAIDSLKTITDRATGLWKNLKVPFASMIKSITKQKGFEIDLSAINVDEKLLLSHKDNFFNIVSLLRRAGYNSIMFLVDKVDEQSLTGNVPEASFKLIECLLKDLELIETPYVSFKFFLWDELKQYNQVAGRPDRIYSYDLTWNWEQMQSMLDLRIKSFSSGKISSFEKLMPSKQFLGRIILFSEFSPRDCIRICHKIFSEQFKHDSKVNIFQEAVINSSIKSFCNEKTGELIGNKSNIEKMIKINRVSFTIEDLVNDKLGSTASAVRNMIRPWTTSGYIKKIGLKIRRQGKSVNEYAFQDVRLAFMACPKLTMNEFIARKVHKCLTKTCNAIFYRDFDKEIYLCPSCNTAAKI